MRRFLAALVVSALPIQCAGVSVVFAQEPSAAGLWQQVDPDTHETQGKNQYWKRLPDCAYAQLDVGVVTKFKLNVPPAPKGKLAPGC